MSNPTQTPPREAVKKVAAKASTAIVQRVDAHPVRRVTRKTLAWTAKRGWQHRQPLAPAYTGVGMLMAGGLADATPAGHGVVLALGLAGGAATAVLDRFRHRTGRTVITTPEVAHKIIAAGAGIGWLEGAATVGPIDGGAMLLLLISGIGAERLAAWLRKKHQARKATQPQQLAPVEDITAPVESPTLVVVKPQVETWVNRIAAPGGPLAGSTLVGVTDLADEEGTPYGWSATIDLTDAGNLTTNRALSVMDQVAKHLQKAVQNVVIDTPPGGEAHLAQIQVFDRNPLVKGREWRGPVLLNPDTGMAPIGMYADTRDAIYQFWSPELGPVHSLVAGGTGSGKSRLIDQLLCYERHSPLITSFVIDPQEGQSLPAWQDNVAWFAWNVEEGLRLIAALHRAMYARNRYLARLQWVDEDGVTQRGVSLFVPTPQMPILSVTIEEAHAILAIPGALKLVEEIAKMARKCGIRLRLITQQPTIDQLGGSSVLRAQVAMGNIVVLRTSDRIGAQVAFQGALPVDPSDLPRVWPGTESRTYGLGFLLGGTARAAMMRTDNVPDRLVRTMASADPGFDPCYVDDLSVTAMGDDFRTWRQRREEEYARDLDFAADATPIQAAASAAASRPLTVLPGGAATRSVEEQPKTGERALAYLEEYGQAPTGVIARQAGAGLTATVNALNRLAAKGLVEKEKHGMWRLAGDRVATGEGSDRSA